MMKRLLHRQPAVVQPTANRTQAEIQLPVPLRFDPSLHPNKLPMVLPSSTGSHNHKTIATSQGPAPGVRSSRLRNLSASETLMEGGRMTAAIRKSLRVRPVIGASNGSRCPRRLLHSMNMPATNPKSRAGAACQQFPDSSGFHWLSIRACSSRRGTGYAVRRGGRSVAGGAGLPAMFSTRDWGTGMPDFCARGSATASQTTVLVSSSLRGNFAMARRPSFPLRKP